MFLPQLLGKAAHRGISKRWNLAPLFIHFPQGATFRLSRFFYLITLASPPTPKNPLPSPSSLTKPSTNAHQTFLVLPAHTVRPFSAKSLTPLHTNSSSQLLRGVIPNGVGPHQ